MRYLDQWCSDKAPPVQAAAKVLVGFPEGMHEILGDLRMGGPSLPVRNPPSGKVARKMISRIGLSVSGSTRKSGLVFPCFIVTLLLTRPKTAPGMHWQVGRSRGRGGGAGRFRG